MAGRKFTTKKKQISFEIDDDEFHLREVIPASTLFEFSNIETRMNEAQSDPNQSIADVMLDAFSKILDDASFETFNARFFGVTNTPMDFETFNDVTQYILGEVSGKEVTQKQPSSKTG